MAGNNAKQVADWNGSVGERWAADQERTDKFIRPYGDAAIAAANVLPGASVLDVGCGCGDTSLAVATLVGTLGRVVGVDVSAPMLEVARRRAVGIGNVTFLQADASTAVLAGPFDVLISRFGVMFFDDPVAAFTHLRRALKPGGRFAFVCWQTAAENPWASLPAQAARKAIGAAATPTDPYAPGPFAFGDRERLEGILGAAGFADTIIEGFEAPMYLGSSPRSAAEGVARIGPASRIAIDAGPDHFPAIVHAIEGALQPYAAEDGSIYLLGRTWIASGRA
ncbi:MAG: class I SAM-dependent methyltransferase [Hyphomonadaceae bacterium]|jgi:ubiquinone/menaquinone biosynthesis C-methylase UbiE